MTDRMQEAYDELYVHTMGRGGPAFVLQHVVDAWAAQTAGEGDTPIRLVFALMGLYLHVERQFTGKQVQHVHMRLGRTRKKWPAIPLPADRGQVTPLDVLAAAAGPDRYRAIDEWCVAVWAAFAGTRATIVALLREHEIV